ncbi:MAG: hydantoinase/oxoprolinase family protein [Acidibacillus sp.]|nr:hydantoinase/oxoprolinase family protein [Acidibacillus sp.]
MEQRRVRVGIDVGGTHTKAVAIDHSTHEILGKASVMTTHDHALGVASGIIEAFHKCLDENRILPKNVMFIAHSTTQATNALLEGDVAQVGILGIGKGGVEGFLAKRQTRIGDIPLGTGKFIRTSQVYRKQSQLSSTEIHRAIDELRSQGAQVIVASKAFGVDRIDEESLVHETADQMGVPCSLASDISKLYGLTIRTRTAAINASILPKMLETAGSTQNSVRMAGITAPLMMMRGDGGVMDIDEMKKRPVLTMLSGPAASVVGSLMYLRASNGIYFEVGGTSTNIGVIKNGRPAVDYSIVGGHRTYISSLDVRVLGVAGGSMVRVAHGKIVDVGPRSAHIAGLGYAVFTDEEDVIDPCVEFMRPKADDPDDYVVIRCKNGKGLAITNTCAANVLGLVKSEYYAFGNATAARKAMEPLAQMLGLSIEETAQQILQKSTEKVITVINELAARYRLEQEQVVLVGVGGGAAALLPYTAQAMNLKYQIPENAEVISSIGVALAMIRDVVERVIPNPSTDDILKIKREVADMAISNGAVEESVEVHVQIDPQTQKVTAIATGSTEVKTTDLLKECTSDEALEIAADSMGLQVKETRLEQVSGGFFVYSGQQSERRQIRVVDKKGFIKIQRRNGMIRKATVSGLHIELNKLWEECTLYKSNLMLTPDLYVLVGSRMLDYSGISSREKIEQVMLTEISQLNEEQEIILIGAKNDM